MDIFAFLKDICAAPGVSGYEGPIRKLIQQAWEPLTDELHTDKLGSLWGIKHAPGVTTKRRPKLMLAAHMDAIGLLVTQIEGEFLRVTHIGGIDARVMPGQLVTVHGRKNLPGIVVQPAAFLLPRALREGVVPLGELLVDVGLTAKEVAKQVHIGDVISFAQPGLALQNQHFTANRLDNRASVAALTLCLEELQHRPHGWDVIAVATVQEEVTLGGAMTSAFALAPQLAIAIDVTFGAGAGTRDFAERTYPLDGGPALGLGPNIHPGVLAELKAAADRLEMDYNIEALPGHSGTDAFGIQVAREGIPTGVVSIPLRNMHTPVEVVNLNDIQRTGRLLAEFISGLEAEFMSGYVWDK